jgi:hypothetical protein
MFLCNYDEQCLELTKFKSKHENNEQKFIKTHFANINVGDIIYITFFPYSQKYIDDLYPLFGTVKEIKLIEKIVDESNDISFDTFTIEKLVLVNDDKTFNGYHDWVSYFGNSRGYEYSIHKLVENTVLNDYIDSDAELDEFDVKSYTDTETNTGIETETETDIPLKKMRTK